MIDFHHVPARQDEIHARLENWARWVKDRPQAWKMQPMWKFYKAPKQWESDLNIPTPLDTLAAHEIERAVSFLPVKHRTAIRWYYVFPRNPAGMAKNLGVQMAILDELVVNARDMLKNRLRESIKEYTMCES